MGTLRRWLGRLRGEKPSEVENERRSGGDRRSGEDRRSALSAPPIGEERRSGADRRSGDDRRGS